MQTYDILINEYQRELITRALKALNDTQAPQLITEEGDRSEPGLCGGEENKLQEIRLLINLLENIPASEKQDPGISHGLCL